MHKQILEIIPIKPIISGLLINNKNMNPIKNVMIAKFIKYNNDLQEFTLPKYIKYIRTQINENKATNVKHVWSRILWILKHK